MGAPARTLAAPLPPLLLLAFASTRHQPTAMYLRLPGPAALSEFRKQRLLLSLHAVLPSLQDLEARYEHLVELDRPLSAEERRVLDRILDYGPAPPDFGDAEYFVVTPRLGTLSPWSSKASEIARRCGLSAVARIERAVVYELAVHDTLTPEQRNAVAPRLHDRMTQTVLAEQDVTPLFVHNEPAPAEVIPLRAMGRAALDAANQSLGLALSVDELDYLELSFRELGRDPSNVELMMFAQANSEHCRHKIFNAGWSIDGEARAETLFGMIRHTKDANPEGIISAYHDNAAIVEGFVTEVFLRDPDSGAYGYRKEPAHLIMKVETHNHPTAISPHPGAATGSGGEIRDEGATGRGSQTKAGLTGFSVSHLRIPGFVQPWETDYGKPARIASALDIMLEGPIGAAAFNNEFGRPNLAGYFRTFEQRDPSGSGLRGYHKPIMLAGGVGSIRPENTDKQAIPPGAAIVVLGGPAMLIGLGGGAASSVASGASAEQLDFASVQRENPEMQRRCQEVINRCAAMGVDNPILSIHDVGAGGLSNAVPEIIHDAGRGGRFDLRTVPNADPGMSPMQLWCNEAQERYVLAVKPEAVNLFAAYCARERCPFAVIGRATLEEHLRVDDPRFGTAPVDIPMSLLFGKPPKMHRTALRQEVPTHPFDLAGIELAEAVRRVLQCPAVADKSFLIHIGDRSVGGLVARDQMVGPWQVPVADVAVTASGFRALTGDAMAVGERTPLALLDAPASGRMAVGEALTNVAAARIGALGNVKLSANWMAACGPPDEDAQLFDTVKAVGLELCPALGIAIPVGKDSLSMKTVWNTDQGEQVMTAPVSLIVSAFAPVTDITGTLTPQLKLDRGVSRLLLIDLGAGRNRIGGSVLAQVYGRLGDEAPDLDDPAAFHAFFAVIQSLTARGLLLAYHDRSDGGLFAVLCEMAFAARCGLEIDLSASPSAPLEDLFNEELGAVVQIRATDRAVVLEAFAERGLSSLVRDVGQPREDGRIVFRKDGTSVFESSRTDLQRLWSETSYRLQSLRDNPDCASQQYDALLDDSDPGLHCHLTFDSPDQVAAPSLQLSRPSIAILREQGVNGHVEMAAAFDRAGFTSVDVHMSDLAEGRASLRGYAGLVACGGFSYGDVLGAGGGWAKSIQFDERLREEFARFFQRPDSFGLGVCNGCQMMSQLKDMIPGAEHWPQFVRNASEQFEARWVLVEVCASPSMLFAGMAGSRLPVIVAHGEGRADYAEDPSPETADTLVALRYVDHYGHVTERFPFNPNGSPGGVTGLTSADGRFTIMMPHPERCVRNVQNTWRPVADGGDSPWMRLFANARAWVG